MGRKLTTAAAVAARRKLRSAFTRNCLTGHLAFFGPCFPGRRSVSNQAVQIVANTRRATGLSYSVIGLAEPVFVQLLGGLDSCPGLFFRKTGLLPQIPCRHRVVRGRAAPPLLQFSF